MVQGMASLRSERIILIIIKRTFLKCFHNFRSWRAYLAGSTYGWGGCSDRRELTNRHTGPCNGI